MRFVLYHANCADGFASAFIARTILGDSTKYYPVQRGQDFEKQNWFRELTSGDKLYILDFSFSLEFTVALVGRGVEVWILDHHQSAVENLMHLPPNLPHLHVTINNEKSGCVLTWEHFHGTDKMPKLFAYIQDRDLWQWRLENSREINAIVSMTPFDFTSWESLLMQRLHSLVGNGALILKYQQTIIDKAIKKARLVLIPGHPDKIMAVNSTVLQSEIGNDLLKKGGNVVCIYFHDLDSGSIILSFRSNDGESALKWARWFKGGGHPNAAGAEVAFLPGVTKL